MNQELTTITETMSSRDIAQLTEKEHKNVLADCDTLNENYKSLSMAEISAVNRFVQGFYSLPNTDLHSDRGCRETRHLMWQEKNKPMRT